MLYADILQGIEAKQAKTKDKNLAILKQEELEDMKRSKKDMPVFDTDKVMDPVYKTRKQNALFSQIKIAEYSACFFSTVGLLLNIILKERQFKQER